MTKTFDKSNCVTNKKLANFPKYITRQTMARFLVQHELFKKQLKVKGSVVECGVHHGGGVMAWAKLSSTLEPYNYHRKIIGFDTFSGFPSVHDIDTKRSDETKGVDLPPVSVGSLKEDYNVMQEMEEVIAEYDENRFINQISKIELIQGDANVTIPKYIEDNQHLLVSLLYLDFDIYEPTVTALKHFLPRMPKGAIIAFDEVNNKYWPGETVALLESLNLQNHRLECFEFEPNISFIEL